MAKFDLHVVTFLVFESFFHISVSSLYIFYYLYLYMQCLIKIIYFTQYKVNLVYTCDPKRYFIAYT